MEINYEDMYYLIQEMNDVMVRFRKDLPEDFYKILLDLLYHSKNTIKEMEIKTNALCNEAGDNSVCKLR